MKINGKNVQIFACSSGTGKTWLARQNSDFVDIDREKFLCKYPELDKNISDKEIEKLKDKVKTKSKDFPENFIKRIHDLIARGKNLLVVPEPLIMDIIHKNNWGYVLIYPDKDCKNEYTKRVLERGNSKEFAMWHDMFFDMYFMQCEKDDKAIMKIKLKPGEFLSDVVFKLEDK